ncbi:MAG TPA: Hsp20/alpha crystallin family protein [Burkholderiaceae bacterium]
MFLVPMPAFNRLARHSGFNHAALRSPALDVAESDAGYNVSLDLPGVVKEEVKIAIDGRHVSVSARSQREETQRDGERLIYRERAAASFERSFALPEEIDEEASLAKLDNGVLSLTLAKKRVAPARTLTVN